MRRLSLTIALVAALAAVPAAEAKPRKRCKPKGVSVVAKNKRAVVFSRTTEEFTTTETVVYGCLRKNGRRIRIASESSNQYATSSLGPIQLRGTFVAGSRHTRVTDGTCQAGVSVFSLAKRRQSHGWSFDGHESSGCSTVGGVVLGPRGRAAFTEDRPGGTTALHKLDATGDHVVDQGAIDPGTVSIFRDGVLTLGWVNGNQARTLRVF